LKDVYEVLEFYTEEDFYTAKRQVEGKLRKWWSKVEECHNNDDYYDETVDKMIGYHLEKTTLYYRGYVCSLKKWGKAREECLNLLYAIKCDLENEFRDKFYESHDGNDPPIPRIHKGPILEKWK
jgi:hypothetical protein